MDLPFFLLTGSYFAFVKIEFVLFLCRFLCLNYELIESFVPLTLRWPLKNSVKKFWRLSVKNHFLFERSEFKMI
ncbi:MAG: hypothetical protein DWQ10_07795 [Calditrichaeota bacterium]|nr:MAG: hypothetical protein DWQ10_07795 [Calditrichota bacterium]